LVAKLPLTLRVTACRAYDPPDTSVPPPVSLGAAVNRPTYHAVGRVGDPVVNAHCRVRVSRSLVKLMLVTLQLVYVIH
jgi:hypothetical protein